MHYYMFIPAELYHRHTIYYHNVVLLHWDSCCTVCYWLVASCICLYQSSSTKQTHSHCYLCVLIFIHEDDIIVNFPVLWSYHCCYCMYWKYSVPFHSFITSLTSQSNGLSHRFRFHFTNTAFHFVFHEYCISFRISRILHFILYHPLITPLSYLIIIFYNAIVVSICLLLS